LISGSVEREEERALALVDVVCERPSGAAEVGTEPVDDPAPSDPVRELAEVCVAPSVVLPRGEPELGDDVGEQVFAPVVSRTMFRLRRVTSTTRAAKGSTSRP
jgi:hypothetical protein